MNNEELIIKMLGDLSDAQAETNKRLAGIEERVTKLEINQENINLCPTVFMSVNPVQMRKRKLVERAKSFHVISVPYWSSQSAGIWKSVLCAATRIK